MVSIQETWNKKLRHTREEKIKPRETRGIPVAKIVITLGNIYNKEAY